MQRRYSELFWSIQGLCDERKQTKLRRVRPVIDVVAAAVVSIRKLLSRNTVIRYDADHSTARGETVWP